MRYVSALLISVLVLMVAGLAVAEDSEKGKDKVYGEGVSAPDTMLVSELLAAPEAFVGNDPVYVESRDEIVELIGQPIYDRMVEQLERPDWVPLAHPTVRAR